MGEWMYISTYSRPRLRLEVSGQLHTPATYSRGKSPRWSLGMRVGGPQNRVADVKRRKILHILDSYPSAVLRVVSPHTDYAIPDSLNSVKIRYLFYLTQLFPAAYVIGVEREFWSTVWQYLENWGQLRTLQSYKWSAWLESWKLDLSDSNCKADIQTSDHCVLRLQDGEEGFQIWNVTADILTDTDNRQELALRLVGCARALRNLQ
jgi:hypothetical protein